MVMLNKYLREKMCHKINSSELSHILNDKVPQPYKIMSCVVYISTNKLLWVQLIESGPFISLLLLRHQDRV